MLQQEVVKPTKRERSFSVMLDPKLNESWQFCNDYCRLKAITIRDTYPIPNVSDCVDLFGETACFPNLNASSGYWQVPIAKEDQDKATFTCQ